MELFFRKLGTGKPLIILHGLYGSSDNWLSIGRALADDHEVYMIDQRNHGHSPHHPEHNYKVMCDDVNDFFTLHHLDRAVFIGHSMGGKTALAFGRAYPQKVEKMIIVDISPFSYDLSSSEDALSHQQIIRVLMEIRPESIVNRRDADMILQKQIPSHSTRQFLLKNLKRDKTGKFYWGLNLSAIANNLAGIFTGISRDSRNGPQSGPQFPLLFIKGEYSGYINSEDEAAIRSLFPGAQIMTIPGAGHWVHSEQPALFLNAVRNFISR